MIKELSGIEVKALDGVKVVLDTRDASIYGIRLILDDKKAIIIETDNFGYLNYYIERN